MRCQDVFFWSQSSVLCECCVRTVRWVEGSPFLIMIILAVISFQIRYWSSVPLPYLTGDTGSKMSFCQLSDWKCSQVETTALTTTCCWNLQEFSSCSLWGELTPSVCHSSDIFNFCYIIPVKWMQKYFIYSLCNAVQSSQGLGSSPESCWELRWSAPLERCRRAHSHLGFASFVACVTSTLHHLSWSQTLNWNNGFTPIGIMNSLHLEKL